MLAETTGLLCLAFYSIGRSLKGIQHLNIGDKGLKVGEKQSRAGEMGKQALCHLC